MHGVVTTPYAFRPYRPSPSSPHLPNLAGTPATEPDAQGGDHTPHLPSLCSPFQLLATLSSSTFQEHLQQGLMHGLVTTPYAATHVLNPRPRQGSQALMSSFLDIALLAGAHCLIGSPSGFTQVRFCCFATNELRSTFRLCCFLGSAVFRLCCF